ncbi:MAG TPA: hypothetical protein VFC58_05215 [Desulfosporosinus sp.]|nr:hypothetical protein [Desulfosporosinus sp.]
MMNSVCEMVVHNITVSFKNENDNWEDTESYQIVSEDSDFGCGLLNEEAPLARAAMKTKINQIGHLPSGEIFLLVNKLPLSL